MCVCCVLISIDPFPGRALSRLRVCRHSHTVLYRARVHWASINRIALGVRGGSLPMPTPSSSLSRRFSFNLLVHLNLSSQPTPTISSFPKPRRSHSMPSELGTSLSSSPARPNLNEVELTYCYYYKLLLFIYHASHKNSTNRLAS